MRSKPVRPKRRKLSEDWKRCKNPDHWICNWCDDDWEDLAGGRKWHLADRVICDWCLSRMNDLLATIS